MAVGVKILAGSGSKYSAEKAAAEKGAAEEVAAKSAAEPSWDLIMIRGAALGILPFLGSCSSNSSSNNSSSNICE